MKKVSAKARDNALIELMSLMNIQGAEYPCAHEKICTKYDLDPAMGERLTAEYDKLSDQFVKVQS